MESDGTGSLDRPYVDGSATRSQRNVLCGTRAGLSVRNPCLRTSILMQGDPLTGEPDAGDPPVRFGGRGNSGSPYPYPPPIFLTPSCPSGSGNRTLSGGLRSHDLQWTGARSSGTYRSNPGGWVSFPLPPPPSPQKLLSWGLRCLFRLPRFASAFLKWRWKPMRLQPSKRSIRSQGLHHSVHFLAQCGVVFRECDTELFVRRHLEGDR
jgi:hypothetical protein